MRIIAVSPHYDDVPLSLGESLRSGALARHEVAVPVVFEHTNWSIQLHPTRGRAPFVTAWRRVEEAAAARWFGYERLPGVGLDECILRTGDLDATSFLDPASDPRLDSSFEEVVAASARWRSAADALLAPLGAGDHVDHRLVTAAAGELVERGIERIGFYEDRPYAATLADHEIAEVAARTGLALVALDVARPATPAKRRRLRALYPSQIDGHFITALRLDEELRRPERIWVPAGESARWRDELADRSLVTGR